LTGIGAKQFERKLQKGVAFHQCTSAQMSKEKLKLVEGAENDDKPKHRLIGN